METDVLMWKRKGASRSQGVGASQSQGVTDSVFAIDPVMFSLTPNEWPDYVMKKGHPEGLA